MGGTAIVRGRLMELLAAEAGTLSPEECDSAFVVGVFSLLDAMLGISMEDAMRAISLPEAVVDVLLHHRGVYAALLELTMRMHCDRRLCQGLWTGVPCVRATGLAFCLTPL